MAEGLLEDCRQLLSRFESRRSVRFETFSQVWKEMNFSFIHCGKKDANGRIQIVDYLFRILTSYLSPSCTLIIREGAVYALYGVYNTQLCNPKVKVFGTSSEKNHFDLFTQPYPTRIRMTLSMWKDLNELQEEMQELKHHDADFILRSLKSCKAFLFCATPTPLTYGSKEAIMNNEKENATKISSDSDKIIKRTCGTLERIYNVHIDYQEAKQGVLALPNSVYSTSLDTAFTNFDVELASDIEEFYKWKQAHCQKFMMNQKRSSILMFAEENISNKKGKQSNDDGGASTSQSSEPQVSEAVSRAKFLRGLKDKSFKQVAQVSRSMRHLKPTLHSEEEHNSSESS